MNPNLNSRQFEGDEFDEKEFYELNPLWRVSDREFPSTRVAVPPVYRDLLGQRARGMSR